MILFSPVTGESGDTRPGQSCTASVQSAGPGPHYTHYAGSSREQYWQGVMISSPLPIILQLAEHSSTESCTGIGSMSLSFLIKKIPCSPVSGLLLITNHISAISKSLGKINILCVLGPCSQSFLFLKSQFINDKEMHSNSFVDNRNKFLQYKDKILYGIFTFLQD